MEHQQQQDADCDNAGHGVQQRGNNSPQAPNRRYDAQDAEHTQRPLDRQRIVGRRQRNGDNDEIESTPRISEEIRPVVVDTENNFNKKFPDHDLIEYL